LEADPTRGVRIKKEAFHAVAGVPRSSEYESVLEQDPFGDTHETGGNDDIWGEWGLGGFRLERHAFGASSVAT